MNQVEDLTIVIVSYGSSADLQRCLPTIRAQSVQPRQIVVVENGPGEETAECLRRDYPDVELIESPVNNGYAGGNNLGVAVATGQWVLLLNPDTALEPGTLESLMAAAHEHPRAIITPKLLNLDGSINACGLEMHVTGIATCRGLGEHADRYTGTEPVPIASGAALLVRKDTFEEVGGFDEQFFMYMEDVDLSLRARLLDYEILCVADTRVGHGYVLGMKPEKFYLLERNRLLALFKVLQLRTLIRLAPALVLTELATWSFAALHGPRYLGSKLRGYFSLVVRARRIRELRTKVQAARTVGDDEVLSSAIVELPLGQLVGGAERLRRFERFLAALYQFFTPAPHAVADVRWAKNP